MKTLAFVAALLLILTAVALFVVARTTPDVVDFDDVDLEPQVKRFLETHSWGGRGAANVPAVDGQTLHNIVLEKGYTRALEIGTSTGHSTIWIASALSKTGGKLITI